MSYTQEQLKDKYNSLPPDIKKAMDSVEIGVLVVEIGEKHGLMLDLQGMLMDQVTLVLLGVISTSGFTDSLVKNLEIDRKTASMISAEINDRVFREIRFSLQRLQEREVAPTVAPAPAVTTPTPAPTPVPAIPNPFRSASLSKPVQNSNSNIPPMVAPEKPYSKPSFEQAGRFTIEKPPVGMPQYKNGNDIDKENVLKGIEDPALTMVDHLLSTPTNTAQGVEIKKPVEKPPVIESKPYTSDPYREQI